MGLSSHDNADCTVLVASCDAYRDIEAPFITLFRRYWPDCPFRVVLLAETGRPDDGGDATFDEVIATGKGKSWCEMLAEALSCISTPYVMLLMNDYLLESRVDTGVVLKRLDQARSFDAANLRLNPNPPGRTPWRDTDLLEFPKNVAYCVTCQTGIWNRDYLEWLARRNRSAWEFERYGSFMLADETRPLLVTRTREFPFVDALHKGYWEKVGVRLCEENHVHIDLASRTLPPFHVRVRECLKSITFAVFPASAIVRLQNAFCSLTRALRV